MPDYSQLLYDPFAPDTVSKLEQFEEFQVLEVPDKRTTIAYIIIMYDLNSDMKKLFPDNLWERKRNSAIAAGFNITNDKFDPFVESMLVGENDKFNDAVLRFVRLFGLPDLPAYLAYTEILHKQVAAAMRENNEKRLKDIQLNIENSMNQVTILERRIFAGDEVENVRAALYRLAERQRLNLRPEHKAKEIETKTLRLPDPYYSTQKKDFEKKDFDFPPKRRGRPPSKPYSDAI